jgi:hypothetical protein
MAAVEQTFEPKRTEPFEIRVLPHLLHNSGHSEQ